MEATTKPPAILIVEDEAKLAALLADYLKGAGYAAHCIANGSEAVSAFKTIAPDLILLDLSLPDRDGIEICRELRSFSRVPIIMVTARVEEIDRLLGLELGADDYICKPFSPREVVARVRAILRRAQPADPSGKISGLTIDETRFQAFVDGHLLDLTPVEFRLLKTLAASPGRVFSRQKLMDMLYSDHRIVTDRTVDSHVKNLRRKIAQVDSGRELVHSIYGVGYKLEP